MPDIKATWKPTAFANTSGVATAAGQELTIEFLTADPTVTPGEPRIWYNMTDFKLKVYDGAATKATAALT